MAPMKEMMKKGTGSRMTWIGLLIMYGIDIDFAFREIGQGLALLVLLESLERMIMVVGWWSFVQKRVCVWATF